MGNDQLSILIQARIDEANAATTIQNQLNALSQRLNGLTVSLNLGNLSSQLNTMFTQVSAQASTQASTRASNATETAIRAFKFNMQRQIDSLSFNSIVDAQKLQRLQTELNALSHTTDNARGKMQDLKEQFIALTDNSTQVTTAINTMGDLEREIIRINEQFKLGGINAQDYVQQINRLIYDNNGNLSNIFTDDIDIRNRERYLNQYQTTLRQVEEETRRIAENQRLIDTFRTNMNERISNLTSNSSVDGGQLSNLQTELNALDSSTNNIRGRFQELNQQFNDLQQSSIQITTATNNMGLLEQEIVRVTEQFKLGSMSLQDYANQMRNLMYNSNGDLSNTFNNDIDINNRLQYIRQYESALNRITQEQRQSEQATQRNNLLLQQQSTFYTQIEAQLGRIENLTERIGNGDNDQLQRIADGYRTLRDNVESGNLSLTEARSRFSQLGTELRSFQDNLSQIEHSISNIVPEFLKCLTISSVLDVGKQIFSSVIDEVRTLDAAMVEFNKVADLSGSQLSSFKTQAYEVAEVMGRIGSDVIEASAGFVQMGATAEEAIKLAENAMLYSNVGDNVNVEDATSTLISGMKAYGIEAKNTIEIVDKMNNVSNNFAISSAGLGEGIQIAASALAAANNSIDESFALMAVGNSVTQNPNTVAHGLKTISMRLRGLSEDGGKLEADMQSLFDTYAKGVKVMTDTGQFRSTFEILNDLGKVWNDLSDAQHAILAEEVAGKHRANIFLAIMENAKELEDVLVTSQNSIGSAVKENEAFMDSIAGKAQQLQSAWQDLATSFLDSSTVKGTIEILTQLVKLAKDFDLLTLAIEALGGALIGLTVIKLGGWITSISTVIGGAITAFQGATTAIGGFRAAIAALNINPVVATVTALTGALMLFTGYMNASKRKAEELAEANRQMIETLEQEKTTLNDVAESYTNIHNSSENTTLKKENLIEVQRQLIDTFGSEAEGIDLVNGKYEENIAKINELTEQKLKQQQISLVEENTIAQNNLDNEMGELNGSFSFSIDESKQRDAIRKALEEVKSQFNDEFDYVELNGNIGFDINTEDVNKAKEVYTALVSELQSRQVDSKMYDGLIAKLNQLSTVSDNASKASNALNSNLAEQAIIAAKTEAGCQDLANATADQVQAIQNYVNTLYDTEPAVAQMMQSMLALENSNFASTIYDGSTAMEMLGAVAADTDVMFQNLEQDLLFLNAAIEEMNNNQIISAETASTLIGRYGELEGALIQTEGGFILNIDAVRQLIQAKLDEANTTASAQAANVQNVLNGVRTRISAYNQEIQAINCLAQAQAALANAKAKQTSLINAAKVRADNAKAQLSTPLGRVQAATSTFNVNAKLQAGQEKAELIAIQGEIQGLEAMVSGYKEIEALQAQMRSINVSNGYSPVGVSGGGSSGGSGGGSSKTPSSSGSNKTPKSSGSKKSAKEKEEKRKRQTYIQENLDELIDYILSSTDKFDEAVDFANEKIANAELKGDLALQTELNKEVEQLMRARRTETEEQAKKLREEGEAITKILAETKLFEDVDLENLTDKDLADVLSKIERQIASLDTEKDEVAIENLEILQNKVEEFGKAAIRIYKRELPELSKSWWTQTNEIISSIEAQVNSVYALIQKALKFEKLDIELEQTGLDEGTLQYLELDQKMLDHLKKALDEEVKAIEHAKAEGLAIDSEYCQERIENAYDLKKQIIQMEKELSRERIDLAYDTVDKQIEANNRDIEIAQILMKDDSAEYLAGEKQKYQNVLKIQENASEALRKIKEEEGNLESEYAQKYLDIWYDAEKRKREMLKQEAQERMDIRKKEIEAELEKMEESQDALQTILDKTIALIKQEQKDKKEALEEQLDLYKELIDKKKKNLKAEQEARDDAKTLKKKQDEVAKVEAKIAELQFDTTASSVAKRLELEEQLSELREDLEDYQYDKSVEKQEEALDEEYNRFKELIDKQLKEIEDYLSQEGTLRQDALDRIQHNSSELYNQLIEWNDKYGTGVREDITNAWDLAMNAMQEYNGGQLNVVQTLEVMIAKQRELNNEIANMKIQDFYGDINTDDILNRPPIFDEEQGDTDDNSNGNESSGGGNQISEAEAKRKMRANQQKYFHQLAAEAKRENDKGKLNWVKSEREKWKFDPETGADNTDGTYVPPDEWESKKHNWGIYHTGGFVGDLKSNEEFAKLLKGEYVATEAQMKNFMTKTLPTIAGVKNEGLEFKFDNLIHLEVQGNLDTDTLPKLEDIIQASVDRAMSRINKSMSNMGYRRGAMSLGI